MPVWPVSPSVTDNKGEDGSGSDSESGDESTGEAGEGEVEGPALKGAGGSDAMFISKLIKSQRESLLT